MKPSDLRDLLLPGLWIWNGKYPGVRSEITLTEDGLMVSAWKSGTEVLAFCITPKSIEDGTYKTTFGPDVKALMERVSKGG